MFLQFIWWFSLGQFTKFNYNFDYIRKKKNLKIHASYSRHGIMIQLPVETISTVIQTGTHTNGTKMGIFLNTNCHGTETPVKIRTHHISPRYRENILFFFLLRCPMKSTNAIIGKKKNTETQSVFSIVHRATPPYGTNKNARFK